MSEHIIQCWCCGTSRTLNEIRTADGYCPECDVEIDLAEYYPKLAEAHDALHAEAEALRAENEKWQRRAESARAMIRYPCQMWDGEEADSQEYAKGYNMALEHVEKLNATPAPEVHAETIDDRLKQAGMLSVAELLKGAPFDAFIKHAGVHDLATLLQWAEMRRGECLRMMARYDLGEKDKGDDLYEWTVAHCAAFTELHVNLRAALAEHGERKEAVAIKSHGAWDGLDGLENLPDGTMLYTTHQPGPDVRALVEALDHVRSMIDADCYNDDMLHYIDSTLSAHHQTQQGGSNDT